jgi:hypothetical protein
MAYMLAGCCECAVLTADADGGDGHCSVVLYRCPAGCAFRQCAWISATLFACCAFNANTVLQSDWQADPKG